MTTGAANQQIVVDADLLQAHVRALSDAADILRGAAANAAGGVGGEAFGALCTPCSARRCRHSQRHPGRRSRRRARSRH